MRTRLLLSLMIIAWIPAAVVAQSRDPEHRDWEIGFFGAISSLGERTTNTPVLGVSGQTSRQVGLKYSRGAEFGMRITQNFGQHWGANLEYSFSNQPLTFKNLADTIPTFPAGHAIHRAAYEVLYYPMTRYDRLRPYVFVGPGITLFHIDANAKAAATPLAMRLTDSWKPALHWGGA